MGIFHVLFLRNSDLNFLNSCPITKNCEADVDITFNTFTQKLLTPLQFYYSPYYAVKTSTCAVCKKAIFVHLNS